MTQNEILNICFSIKNNIYPKIACWYSSVYMYRQPSANKTSRFQCKICFALYETISQLDLHGKSHLEEATRILNLREFL